VLLFAAEDALHIVRRRLNGIGGAAGVALADLDILVITAPIVSAGVHVRPRLESGPREAQQIAGIGNADVAQHAQPVGHRTPALRS
jgi:hypothetical protein